jgi:hypothetical protein
VRSFTLGGRPRRGAAEWFTPARGRRPPPDIRARLLHRLPRPKAEPESKVLELLLILAVLVYLVSRLDAHHLERPNTVFGPASRPGATSLPPERRPALRLAIEGTQRPYFRSNAFVKGFGVNPQLVQDIRIYSHFGAVENFPAAVVALLQDLYLRGGALGSEVMELLFHGRTLREGEAVYFALLDAKPEPRVVAFVDKLRTA